MAQNDLNQRPNFLIIMTDEHDPGITGCYGHPTVRTPFLDRLAREGVVFDNAYCNSPVCSPSRMAFLTGRYVHQIGVWDNGAPLRSEIPTFANYLEAEGYDTVLCGRMHMLGKDRFQGFGKRLYEDWTGHTDVRRGPRRTPESQRGSASHVTDAGPGRPLFQEYDETVSDLSIRFLQSRAATPDGRPWVLVSGFMYPHFPLVVPHDYFDMYYPENVVLPNTWNESLESQHPVVRQIRHFMRVAQDLPEEMVRRALACYYGLVTMTDQNVGRMLETIDNSALRENTVVIYTTDHGDSGGHHGLWQKNCFYEPSVRVPLIIRVPGGARGIRVRSCSSLVDIAPTLYEMAGVSLPDKLSGESLVDLLHGSENGQRVAFSEYHSNGMLNAGYMIRKGKYKYNHYVDYEPQLFDLFEDPDEINDLGQDPQYQAIRDEMNMELLRIVDPEQVDQEAKENQSRKVEDRASWFSWLSFTDLIDHPVVDGGSNDRSVELVD